MRGSEGGGDAAAVTCVGALASIECNNDCHRLRGPRGGVSRQMHGRLGVIWRGFAAE